MTREEHIKWCKERALIEIEFYKEGRQGIISMMSDLGKHPETQGHIAIQLAIIALMGNPTIESAKRWINGVN